MKTAISVPDDIFEAAERYAERTGMSRSHLYARAVAQYLAAQRQNNVRELLNLVYGNEDSSLDSSLEKMQRVSIAREKW